jgi:amidohydrolase
MSSLRRELHRYPETGFELPFTCALVCRELETFKIAPTDRYGKGSIVAEIGSGKEVIALRADMDALPIEEKTGLEFSSKRKGFMHACGHDAHTAVLLAVARYLKAHENELKRRIRFIFQPAEESSVSGARMMLESGVLNGVSEVIAAHCDNSIPVGEIGLCSGDYMAACIPATFTFRGKASHATVPEEGIDAVAMAVECYGKLKSMVKKEAGEDLFVWNVGRLCGGNAHNVVPDVCTMDVSFRFYDLDFAKRVERAAREICDGVAKKIGGSVDVLFDMSTGAVHNDEELCNSFKSALKESVVSIRELKPVMTSEDFGWFSSKTKGILFRFGTGNNECRAALHSDNFNIDEKGMKTAFLAFVSYLISKEEKL